MRKSYMVRKSFVEAFNEINLPNQLAYDSRLIGRWMCQNNNEKVEIFAIREYDSYEAYTAIETSV